MKLKKKLHTSKKKKVSVRKRAKKTQKRTGYAPGLLAGIGGGVGAYFGGSAGAQVGRAAGSWLGRITGMGDYRVNSNTLLTNNAVPSFSSTGQGVRICHREFLTDISGSVAFSSTSYAINPGILASFPWLSAIAAQFEEWELKGAVYEFKTTSATAVASTNTALGTVILATNYDALDSAFVNKQQMEQYEFACSTVPCASVLHPVECNPKMNPLSRFYVRTGDVTGDDLRFSDLGNFQIATVGMQAAAVIGELWLSYDIILYKPKIQTPIGANLTFAHVTEYAAASATAAAPFGTTAGSGSVRTGSTLPTVVTSTTFTLPLVGTYLCAASWVSANVGASPIFTEGANLTGLSILNNNAGAEISNYGPNIAASMFAVYTVTSAGTGAANTVTVTGLTSMTGGKTDLFICQVPSGLTLVLPPTSEQRLEYLERFMSKFLSIDEDFDTRSISSSRSVRR